MEDTKNICVGDILTDNFDTLYLVVGINIESNCIVCRIAAFDGMSAFRLNCVNSSDFHPVQIGDKICRIRYGVTVEIPVTVTYKTPLESTVILKEPDHYEYLDHLSPHQYFDFIAGMHDYYRRKCLYDQGFVRTKLRQSDDLYVTAGDIYRNKVTNTYVLVAEAEVRVDNLFVTAYESTPKEYTEADIAEHGGYYFSEIDTTILVDTRQEIQCTRRDNQLVIDPNYEYVRTVAQFKLNHFKTLLAIHDNAIHGESDHPLPDSIISLGYLDDGKQKWQSVEVGINYTKVQELLFSQWDKFKTTTLDLESMRGYGETKEDALKEYTKCFDAIYDELTKFHNLLHSGGEIPMEEMQYGFIPLDK